MHVRSKLLKKKITVLMRSFTSLSLPRQGVQYLKVIDTGPVGGFESHVSQSFHCTAHLHGITGPPN